MILNNLFFDLTECYCISDSFKQHSITEFNPTNLSFIKYIQSHYIYCKDWKTSCFPFLLLYCLLYIILLFVFSFPLFLLVAQLLFTCFPSLINSYLSSQPLFWLHIPVNITLPRFQPFLQARSPTAPPMIWGLSNSITSCLSNSPPRKKGQRFLLFLPFHLPNP